MGEVQKDNDKIRLNAIIVHAYDHIVSFSQDHSFLYLPTLQMFPPGLSLRPTPIVNDFLGVLLLLAAFTNRSSSGSQRGTVRSALTLSSLGRSSWDDGDFPLKVISLPQEGFPLKTLVLCLLTTECELFFFSFSLLEEVNANAIMFLFFLYTLPTLLKIVSL